MDPSVEEPPPGAGRRRLLIHTPSAESLAATLRSWDGAGAILAARRSLSARARAVIQCQVQLRGELLDWHRRGGKPPGELRVAVTDGWTQGLAAIEPLERSVFIHYLISAPWNALTADDVADLRTTRGACCALIGDAVRLSAALGLGGLVSLEAENDQCRSVYRHLGFRQRPFEELQGALPADLQDAPETWTRCWMLLDPARSERFGALVCERPKAA